jgi:hypothetical protein
MNQKTDPVHSARDPTIPAWSPHRAWESNVECPSILEYGIGPQRTDMRAPRNPNFFNPSHGGRRASANAVCVMKTWRMSDGPLGPIKGAPLKSLFLINWGFGVSNPNGVQGQRPWPFTKAC